MTIFTHKKKETHLKMSNGSFALHYFDQRINVA